ncbi:MAG: hypothetical protein NE334_02750 [Lentisphaeraceae bacterium]|nr:hypothetical protein [Lentisphaeraceae bacterium]
MENSTEQSQKGKNVFMTMVGLLGLNAEVKDKASGKNIILSVSTDEPGRLIGRNGSSLDSVGLLMNRILRKEDNTFPKVIIDVDGYDKRSKNDRRKKRSKANPKAQKNTEKTVVMSEEAAEHEINLYVDDESGKVDPITTVAPGEQERKAGRDNNRRNSRRDNNRNNNRRNSRRDNNRNNNTDSKPAAKQEAPNADVKQEAPKAPAKQEAPKADSKPAAVKQEAPKAPARQEAPKADSKPAVAKQEASVQVAEKPVKQEAPKAPAKQEAPKADSKPKSSPNRLQMQCRNAAKEVKRWGEDVLLPPLSQDDCDKAIQHFANDKEIKAQIDNSKSSGDKKRVRLTTAK